MIDVLVAIAVLFGVVLFFAGIIALGVFLFSLVDELTDWAEDLWSTRFRRR